MNKVVLPVIAINRHRMGTDGEGVTTLVASHGCPLECRYCINKKYLTADMLKRCRNLTPEELYDEVKIDDLYFVATNGGIAFGGGESLIHAEFIKEFREICGNRWRIVAETSLNIPSEKLYKVMSVVDEFSIDIKDMDDKIYKSYTGRNNDNVINNLNILIEEKGSDNLYVRVPQIRDYNTRSDIERSIEMLERMGIKNIEVFSYIIRE